MATTYKKIKYDGNPTMCDVAEKDSAGNVIKDTYVKTSGDETISGTKTFSSPIKTDEVDNSNGNAIARYKSTENKVVLGGSTIPTTIMGSGDRPNYSKDGSDFTGEPLALLSDVSGGGTIADGSVTTAKLADGAVTNAKIADRTITTDKINTSFYINMDHLDINTNLCLFTVSLRININDNDYFILYTKSIGYNYYFYDVDSGSMSEIDNEVLIQFLYGIGLTNSSVTGYGVINNSTVIPLNFSLSIGDNNISILYYEIKNGVINTNNISTSLDGLDINSSYVYHECLY